MKYKSFKKTISCLLSASMLIAALIMPSVSAEAEPLLYENFNNYTGDAVSGWSKFSGSASQYTMANLGDLHGNCLAMKSVDSGTPSAEYSFSSALSAEGIYRISLYTRSDSNTNSFIMYFLDSAENIYKTFQTGTNILIYTGDQKSYSYTLCDSFLADSWYRFDIWMDMQRDKIWYVVTDKHGSTYTYETDYSYTEDFKKIRFTQYNKDNTVYLDDISVEKATRNNINKWLAEGVKVPDEIANSFEVSAGSENMGNIFFDDEKADMWADIKNCDTAETTKTLSFTVKNTDHKTVWSKAEEITLAEGEEKRISFTPDIKKYGTYMLEIKDGENLLCYVHLSRCVKNTTLNKRLGLSTHTTRSGADLAVLELMQSAGFGFARENFRWNRDDSGNVVDTTTGTAGDFVDRCIELGIEPYALMRVECSPEFDDGDGGYATSKEALKGAEEYYRLIAEKLKGKVQYFSAWCELYFIKEPDGETVADGADYAKILKAAYKGLKEGNPDAKLIGFNDFIGKSVSRVTYRQALDTMKKEGTYYFDIFGTHPYHASKAPEVKEYWDENNSWIDLDTYLDEIVNEYGLEDMMRWANEVGYYSSDYDDESKAAYSIRMLLLNDALDSYDVMNIQCLQDMYSDPNSYTPYGLLRCWKGLDTPHSAKPQYIAYSWWNYLMNGAEFVDWTNTDDKYICNYTNGEKKITAVWDVSGNKDKLTLPTNGNSVSVYDMYGNLIDTETAKKTITVEYDQKPVFVVEEDKTELKPFFEAVSVMREEWSKLPIIYRAK